MTFVHHLVQDHYSCRIGRPSIDSVVFFKLHRVMFFEGIRSERMLLEVVNLKLAHRGYIGYDLDEPVLSHSSLSKIRDYYDLEIFQAFFEHIIILCIQARLVWGNELYSDGTNVQANASMDRLEPCLELGAQQHLQALFPKEKAARPQAHAHRLVDKFDGTRILSRPSKYWYHRTTDRQVSRTDPDATPMKASNREYASLGYHIHYVVDGGKARVILAALVTQPSMMDSMPMLDLVRWVRFRWQVLPQISLGDTKYGTVSNIVGLEQDGIRAYLATPDFSHRSGFYLSEMFHYDTEREKGFFSLITMNAHCRFAYQIGLRKKRLERFEPKALS